MKQLALDAQQYLNVIIAALGSIIVLGFIYMCLMMSKSSSFPSFFSNIIFIRIESLLNIPNIISCDSLDDTGNFVYRDRGEEED